MASFTGSDLRSLFHRWAAGVLKLFQRSLARGFVAYGLALLEGLSLGFMDALNGMRHLGHSMHYW